MKEPLPFFSLIIGYMQAVFSLPFPLATKLTMLLGMRNFLAEAAIPIR